MPQLGAGTEVLFQGVHVGEVVGTVPPRIGLQLLVASAVAPELRQIITLFPGQRVRLTDPSAAEVEIALLSLAQATIRHVGGAHSLRRVEPNRWLVDQSGSRDTLTVNGIALPRKPRTAAVRTGDVLAIGPVQVEWQDVSEYGRVDVHIALKKLRKAAAVPDTTTAEFLLGPRSSLGIANVFGLGKPSLRLEPAYGRQPFVLGADSVIAPAPTVDLERSVQGMITYLNSPAALRRTPATRFERLVSDLNDGLEQVAQLGARLDTILNLAKVVSREQGGRGMIGRLVLSPAALESLDATAAGIAAGTVLFSDTSRSVLSRLKLDTLETAVTRAVVSADRTLRQADSVIGLVGDSLPRVLGRINKFLAQGTGTVKGVQGWIPPVAIAGMALSLAGILKLIGVF